MSQPSTHPALKALFAALANGEVTPEHAIGALCTRPDVAQAVQATAGVVAEDPTGVLPQLEAIDQTDDITVAQALAVAILREWCGRVDVEDVVAGELGVDDVDAVAAARDPESALEAAEEAARCFGET